MAGILYCKSLSIGSVADSLYFCCPTFGISDQPLFYKFNIAIGWEIKIIFFGKGQMGFSEGNNMNFITILVGGQ